eukprot:464005-Prorocentrum_minimum.AAC.1
MRARALGIQAPGAQAPGHRDASLRGGGGGGAQRGGGNGQPADGRVRALQLRREVRGGRDARVGVRGLEAGEEAAGERLQKGEDVAEHAVLQHRHHLLLVHARRRRLRQAREDVAHETQAEVQHLHAPVARLRQHLRWALHLDQHGHHLRANHQRDQTRARRDGRVRRGRPKRYAANVSAPRELPREF